MRLVLASSDSFSGRCFFRSCDLWPSRAYWNCGAPGSEECTQEAFAQALERWPHDGVPHRPGAWLTTTARNRALDRLRRGATEAAKLREVARMLPDERQDRDGSDDGDGFPDDRLRLMFTCCHPALPLDARVALTLRTLAGLSTGEIARAFLVSEKTMAQRLVRAKNKIRNAGIPFRVPPRHLLAERTPAVLAVLYLLFNEGYSASGGAELVRTGLTGEAIRLCRLLVHLLPGEPEARGLLALMLLHDARRGTRLDSAGELVPLEAQDRSRWNRSQINEAVAIIEQVRRNLGRSGPYLVQAAITARHAIAPDAASTDWAQIALLLAAWPRWLARLSSRPAARSNTWNACAPRTAVHAVTTTVTAGCHGLRSGTER
jgi:RNA polymerase sigma-70 factor (ECF subfamily)